MSPLDYALAPFRKYADFRGRARRAEYWWFYLFVVIISIVASLVDGVIAGGEPQSFPIVSAVVSLATVIPYLAVAVRRFHDRDMSGWLVLIPVVILFMVGVLFGTTLAGGGTGTAFGILGLGILAVAVAGIWMLVMMCLPGTRGPNRFGEDPKGGDHDGSYAR